MEENNSTQRLEAFSDGVFAIAITLLILEIKIPHLPHAERGSHLRGALGGLWPEYLAYIFSFVSVGIYWANHHYVFKMYRRVDHTFLLLNVLFLMCISFVPLPTAVLGEYVTDARERHSAIIFYNFGLLLPTLAWTLSWLYAQHRGRLIDPRLEPKFVRFLTRQYLASCVLYLFATLVAWVNGTAGLTLSVIMTVFYLMPPRPPVYRPEESTPPSAGLMG